MKGTLNRVVKGEYEMPKHISLEAQDLIFRLLQKVCELCGSTVNAVRFLIFIYSEHNMYVRTCI